MDDTAVILATTTDEQATVEAALGDDEAAARVPVESSSLSEFRHSAEDGTQSLAYESPISSRHQVEQELAEAEKDLAALSTPEETEARTEPGDGVDLDAVRKAATADAIEAGRRLVAERQEQPSGPTQAELDQLRSELAVPFAARMQELKASTPDFKEVFEKAITEGVDISPKVADVLLALPGGPETAVYLARNKQERERLARLPDDVAAAAAAQLAARFDPALRARRSAAPAPIKPVGGSATKSSVPLDEMPYSEYRKLRDQQERARYRR
jgi:hypothetical protein